MMEKPYDVAIVGAGVTGPGVAVTLTYTNVDRIALIEKEGGVAQINSGHEDNSQTLHFGDIETNFTPEKTKKVRDSAELVAAYALKNKERGIAKLTHKMVIAVGRAEVDQLVRRFEAIKEIFPKARLLDRDEIAKYEPNVTDGRSRRVPLKAIFSPDGFVVNYGRLAESFLRDTENSGKTFDQYFRTTVQKIKPVHDGRAHDGFEIFTDRGVIKAKMVLVNAGAHTLLIAKRIGYAKTMQILPIAGSFFRTSRRDCVNGKVYTMQYPGIPFAAPHADPEVTNPHETRFGPTAKAVFMLERHRYGSVIDFLRTMRWHWRGLLAFVAVLFKANIFAFALKNLLYDVPWLGKLLFLGQIRKIIPTMKSYELQYAKGVGGIRPQIVDTQTYEMPLGAGRIVKPGLIFNITPSPGATNCLGSAIEDVEEIVKFLNDDPKKEKLYRFERERFVAEHTRNPGPVLVRQEA